MADTESLPAWTALYETEQLISAKSFDLRRTARSCFELGLQVSGAEVGFLAVLDRRQDLVVQASKGVDDEAILEEPRLAKLFEQALSQAQILVETSFTGGGPLPLRLANLLVVPLLLKIRPLDDGDPRAAALSRERGQEADRALVPRGPRGARAQRAPGRSPRADRLAPERGLGQRQPLSRRDPRPPDGPLSPAGAGAAPRGRDAPG